MKTVDQDHWPFHAKTLGETCGTPPPEFRQVGGTHYVDKKIQPWDAMEAWMTNEQFTGFLLGSAIAYLARFNTVGVPGKGGLDDVKKAHHYCAKLIEMLELRDEQD